MTHIRRGGRGEKEEWKKKRALFFFENTWMEGTSKDKSKDFYLLKNTQPFELWLLS